jgi:serine/threonine-protein kinase HipA
MTGRTLVVLLNGRLVGEVKQRDNKLCFRYDEQWRQSSKAIPLSLSMPLSRLEHSHDVISAYMWGLLPDNKLTLSEIGKEFHVSANNCFALLSAIGEDCPGAVQFIPPERLNEFNKKRGVEWLKDSELEELIIGLKKNPAAVRRVKDTGRFSLPGVQAKTALYRENDRWGVPQGRTPTTHILKPTIEGFDGQAENEFFCLQLAGRVGLPRAETEILMIADTAVVCSKRYDRQPNREGAIVRLHQEDLCQALAIPPDKKYQNEGGPGISQIIGAIDRFSSKSSEDRVRFIQAIALNFIIFGTDAHAKNYSLLIAPVNQVRLAPLYDMASYIPYLNGNAMKLKMPMKIGGEYRFESVGPSDWEETAKETDFEPEKVIAYLRDLIARVPGQALSVLHDCRASGLRTPALDRLVDGLWGRLRSLAQRYGAEEL